MTTEESAKFSDIESIKILFESTKRDIDDTKKKNK